MKRLAIAALLLLASGPLAAHGAEHTPAVAPGWTLDPILTIPLALTLLVLHTIHVLTDLIDTAVLTALMFTVHGQESRRFVDVSENSLYWRFVWLSWLPIYALIYWLPRWAS